MQSSTHSHSPIQLKDEVFITSQGEIVLRPFSEKDIEFQLSYLYESPREFLEQIGFDLSKLPGREIHRNKLKERIESDRVAQTFHSVAAEINKITIAAVFLQLREFPDIPRGHFHIYDPHFRGKGLGLPILKTGLRLLLKQHLLSRIYIEPKFDNIQMNKLMQKAGFNFLGESIYSGPTTTHFKSHRYEVLAEMLSL